ncbi:MAG: tyrosine-type recombinase/integrase [Patescibacteria group bacterium]|nr:tyrosine-type recombinase/integrase [Patescibacteria group bacterium]
MARRQEWPPRPYQTRGQERMKVWRGGRRVDVLLGPAGSEEARLAYARIIQEITVGDGQLLPVKQIRVAEVMDSFLRMESGRYSQGEKSKIKRAIGTAVDLYGPVPAEEFRAMSLRACMSKWAEEGINRAYINQLALVVRRIWRWAASMDLVPATLVAQLGTVPGLRKGQGAVEDYEPVGPCDLRDVERTLPFFDRKFADLIRLLTVTGARPGEMAALTPEDVDRDWRTIEGQKVWLFRLDEHKTAWQGGLRWIPLVPAAQEILLPHLQCPPSNWCFPNRDGKRIEACGVSSRVRTACAKAGTKWHAHQIRHAVATQLQIQMSREDARCVLGHATLSMTARYAQSVERGAMALLNLKSAM